MSVGLKEFIQIWQYFFLFCSFAHLIFWSLDWLPVSTKLFFVSLKWSPSATEILFDSLHLGKVQMTTTQISWFLYLIQFLYLNYWHLGLVNILCCVCVWRGGCPMHCSVFNSILGYYQLDASGTLSLPQVMTIKDVFRYCQVSLGGQNSLWLRTTDLDHIIKLQ